MKKNRSRYLIGTIIIGIIIIATVFYINIKPSVIYNDISVEAILELNKTDINVAFNNCYEYVLDVKMTKNKNCNIIVYPYIEAFISKYDFNTEESGGYFLPYSLGRDQFMEPFAIEELKNQNIIKNDKDVKSLLGFWFPNKSGEYKSRLYFNKDGTNQIIENPVLICVYTEKKYGKDLTWSVVVPITVNTLITNREEEQKTEASTKLTLQIVKKLSRKGYELSWEDFKTYYGTVIGRGLMMYPINNNYELRIGGGNHKGRPMYINLVNKNTQISIDIRHDDIDEFVK